MRKELAGAVLRENAEGKPDDSAITFVISDETKDRYGDVVQVDGWDTKNFLKNPVLLWAHRYGEPPVGKMPTLTTSQTADRKVIKGTVSEWVPREVSQFAWAVEQMVRKGFLNAVSVGFLPIEFTFNDDWSMNFIKQELLEVSVVPVPANPNALAEAKGLGLWVPEIDRWVERTLDERKPGIELELARRAHQLLKPAQAAVPRAADVDFEEPLPELVELRDALRENTQVNRELVAELRAAREAGAADRIAEKALKLLKF